MKRKIALGPGAASLILIVVILSLCMLAMLTQIGSRNDYNLTMRGADMISRVYDLNAKAERRLADLDAVLVRCAGEADGDMEAYLILVEDNLPEGCTIWDNEVTWTDPLDNRTLTCTVRLLPLNAEKRTEWVLHKLAVEEPEEELNDGDT